MANNKPTYTLQQAIQKASQNGGRCLSNIPGFFNRSTKLEWECNCQYRWLECIGNVLNRKYFCPKCSRIRNKYTIGDMHEFAKQMGWECLSTAYIHCYGKLKWKCSNGHIRNYDYAALKKLRKCTECEKEKEFSELKDFVEKKGGQLITIKMVNRYKKAIVKCENGHMWEVRTDHLKNGNWCPDCHINHKEEKCRFIFENLIGIKFKKTHSELFGKLELDGYCEELRLAFEYQGQQHFFPVNFSKKLNAVEVFKSQQIRDDKKRKLCEEKKIKLITVPYYMADNNEILSRFIYVKLLINKIHMVKTWKQLDFKLFLHGKPMLDRLQKFAQAKGGKLLSEVYEGMGVHHL